MRKIFDLVVLIALAILGPRIFGLVDASSSILAIAGWGAAFGIISPIIGVILFDVVLGKGKKEVP